MVKGKWTTMRITQLNKNFLELERMIQNQPTLDDALTKVREKYREARRWITSFIYKIIIINWAVFINDNRPNASMEVERCSR